MNRAVASLLLLLAAGCQTTRYDVEVRQAADQVRERTGWTPQWSAPWADRVPQWDGHAPLTVRQAVTTAVENNRSIRADVTTIGTARADFVQAGLLPNPVLSFVYRFPVGDTTYVMPISVAQTISDLWRLPARTDAARAGLQEALLRVSAGALELVAKVKTSHARIVEAQNSLRLLAENARTLDQARKLAKSKFDAGTGTQLDVTRVEAEQLENQSTLAATEAELGNEKYALLELLGLAEFDSDWQAQEETPAAVVWGATEGEKAIMNLARTQRLDVLAARWNCEAMIHKLRDQKLGVIPKVDLGAEYENADAGTFTLGPAVAVELPVFDQNQARIAGARADLAHSYALAAAAQQQAVREGRQAWRAYLAARQQIDLYQQQVLPLQQRNLKFAGLAFNSGDSDLTTLLDVQRAVNQAQLKLAELQRDLLVAHAELERAVGGGLLLTPPAVAPATRPAGAATQPGGSETRPGASR